MGLVSVFHFCWLLLSPFCHSCCKRFDVKPTSVPMVIILGYSDGSAISSKRLTISKPFVLLSWKSRARCSCLCMSVFVSAYLSLTKLSIKNNCGGYILKNRTQNSQVVPKIFCHWFMSYYESIMVWEIYLCSVPLDYSLTALIIGGSSLW